MYFHWQQSAFSCRVCHNPIIIPSAKAIICIIRLSIPNINDRTKNIIKYTISAFFNEICLFKKSIINIPITPKITADAPTDSLENIIQVIIESTIAVIWKIIK